MGTKSGHTKIGLGKWAGSVWGALLCPLLWQLTCLLRLRGRLEACSPCVPGSCAHVPQAPQVTAAACVPQSAQLPQAAFWRSAPFPLLRCTRCLPPCAAGAHAAAVPAPARQSARELLQVSLP